MNILVINGSPKGSGSITLQSIHYLEKCRPNDSFTIYHIGPGKQPHRKIFDDLRQDTTVFDGIIFSYPVYTFTVPSQLHRFIEEFKQQGPSVEGKFVTQLSTSMHFYDTTAHRFMEENFLDMGMRPVHGLSAEMEDLLSEQGRRELLAFYDRFVWCISHGVQDLFHSAPRPFAPVPATRAEPVPKQEGDVVIVTDLAPEDGALQAMIDRFRAVLPRPSRVVNLRDFPFRGGCLGCMLCAADGVCVHKDGFDRFLRDSIQSARATVYAFTLRDHSMGSLMKQYDDRQFCDGHRTVTMGTPVGYLINGPISSEPNLQTILEARSQVGSHPLAGLASNERDTDGQIDAMAMHLSYLMDHSDCFGRNFYHVGGMKIFRDLVYLMQGLMKADHRFYKSRGFYDFPQKKKGKLVKMHLVGLLFSPKLRSRTAAHISKGMLAPYEKVLEQARPEP